MRRFRDTTHRNGDWSHGPPDRKTVRWQWARKRSAGREYRTGPRIKRTVMAIFFLLFAVYRTILTLYWWIFMREVQNSEDEQNQEQLDCGTSGADENED